MTSGHVLPQTASLDSKQYYSCTFIVKRLRPLAILRWNSTSQVLSAYGITADKYNFYYTGMLNYIKVHISLDSLLDLYTPPLNNQLKNWQYDTNSNAITLRYQLELELTTIDNSKQCLSILKNMTGESISTFGFSTLYTNLPLQTIYES